MKIILASGIYPPEFGGPATYSRELAKVLREKGHAVTVVTYGDPSPTDERVIRVSRRGGPVIRYLRYAWQVFRAARKADMVYAQGAVSEGLPAAIGARFAGRPLAMRIPGDYAWEMAQQRGESELLDAFLKKRHRGRIGFYEMIERWTARQAQRVIVPSQYLRAVVERWGVCSERIVTAINAIEPLPETRGREAERTVLNVGDRVVLMTAVRAVPWKGVGELIAWWKRLPSTHLLVVAGDGPDLERWKIVAKDSGVSDRIRFLGRIDRVTLARWIEVSDAFVLHSGYEGYPFVVAEACSRGVPCFVSDQGGNPETKTSFPGLVTVLPYRHEDAWVDALTSVRRRTSVVLPVMDWTHHHMVDVTENALLETSGLAHVGRFHALMVSYDRSLLNRDSEVMMRVSSFAQEGDRVTALVISSGDSSAVDQGAFRAFGFSGSSFGRMWKAFWRGVRDARGFSGRTIITAQDPFAAGLLGYAISRIANVPLEIQEHGDFFSGEWAKELWMHRPMSWFGAFMLRRAERVRVVSERVKEHVIRRGVQAGRIEVISVSQDLEALLARPLSASSNVFRMVAPCRFVSQKGLGDLLQAAAQLRERRLSFHLHLIGRGPLEKKLRGQIEALRLTDCVFIEPWRDSQSLWEGADLLVLASHYEGWGRTIVEAMAAGVPIVTTDVGCVGSFFRPQIDGRVVAPHDPNALASAIAEQMNERERRDAMRDTARRRARDFSSREVLHDAQRRGWRSMLRPLSEVGPRWDAWVGALIAFAIVSRMASVILFHASLASREWGFFSLVDSWFQGYGYSFAHQLGCASAYRSPGYLFFLTGLYSVFSPSNTWAQAIIQNAFVVGVIWLVYAVGSRLVGKRGALLGAFAMAIYPYTFYHYTQYYHTFLSSFFLLLVLWFVLKFVETSRLRCAIGSGLAIGCLAYVQGTILPATPLIAAWVLWKMWPEWKTALKGILLMAFFSAGVIAPWTYRNWTVFHHVVPLTTDLGFALYKANNEVIYALTERGYPQEVVDEMIVSSTDSGYLQYRIRPEIEDELKQDGVFRDAAFWTMWHPKEPTLPVPTCADFGTNDEVQQHEHWMALAKTWLKDHWVSEGWKLQLLKVRTFWQPSLFPSVKMGAQWSFAGNPLKEWLARSAVTASAAVVIFGGLIGILYALRRRDERVWLPLSILIVYTIMHSFFAGYTKYRIPLDNLMAIYAGFLVGSIWDWVRGRRTPLP